MLTQASADGNATKLVPDFGFDTPALVQLFAGISATPTTSDPTTTTSTTTSSTSTSGAGRGRLIEESVIPTVGGLLLIGLIGWFFIRRRSKKRKQPRPSLPGRDISRTGLVSNNAPPAEETELQDLASPGTEQLLQDGVYGRHGLGNELRTGDLTDELPTPYADVPVLDEPSQASSTGYRRS